MAGIAGLNALTFDPALIIFTLDSGIVANIHQLDTIRSQKEKIARFLEIFSASGAERIDIGLTDIPPDSYHLLFGAKHVYSPLANECIEYTAQVLLAFSFNVTINGGTPVIIPYDRSTACQTRFTNMQDVDDYVTRGNPTVINRRDITTNHAAKERVIVILYRFLKSIENELYVPNQQKILQEFVNANFTDPTIKRTIERFINDIVGIRANLLLVTVTAPDTRIYSDAGREAAAKYNTIIGAIPAGVNIARINIGALGGGGGRGGGAAGGGGAAAGAAPAAAPVAAAPLPPSPPPPVLNSSNILGGGASSYSSSFSSFLIIETTIIKKSPFSDLLMSTATTVPSKKQKSRSPTRKRSRSPIRSPTRQRNQSQTRSPIRSPTRQRNRSQTRSQARQRNRSPVQQQKKTTITSKKNKTSPHPKIKK